MTKQQIIEDLLAKIAELEAALEAERAKHSRKGRAGRKPVNGTAALTDAERAARWRERRKNKNNEIENSG